MNSKTLSEEKYIESDITRLVLNHLQLSTTDFSRWLQLLDENAVI